MRIVLIREIVMTLVLARRLCTYRSRHRNGDKYESIFDSFHFFCLQRSNIHSWIRNIRTSTFLNDFILCKIQHAEIKIDRECLCANSCDTRECYGAHACGVCAHADHVGATVIHMKAFLIHFISFSRLQRRIQNINKTLRCSGTFNIHIALDGPIYKNT